jgi:hypothetical protein
MHLFTILATKSQLYWACSDSNGLYGTFGLILVFVTFKGISIKTEQILNVYG